jgi:hypothetical protein
VGKLPTVIAKVIGASPVAVMTAPAATLPAVATASVPAGPVMVGGAGTGAGAGAGAGAGVGAGAGAGAGAVALLPPPPPPQAAIKHAALSPRSPACLFTATLPCPGMAKVGIRRRLRYRPYR